MNIESIFLKHPKLQRETFKVLKYCCFWEFHLSNDAGVSDSGWQILQQLLKDMENFAYTWQNIF